MAQEEADQVGEINEVEDIPQYPTFKFVRGFLSRNEGIRESVNLALKVFHHDATALAIYRPLAQMYYTEIENEVILHALNLIRYKGCIFSLFAANDYLVSLKAAFPLEHPSAPVPIVGFYMRYTATHIVEDAKHSQQILFFVKVLPEFAHLMIYYFNKAKERSTGTVTGSSAESNDLTTTPTNIGAIVVKGGQIKGDPGIALEETLFGGRIIPNPDSKLINRSFASSLQMHVRRDAKIPASPDTLDYYEIQRSYTRKIVEEVSKLNTDDKDSFNIGLFKVNPNKSNPDIVPIESVVEREGKIQMEDRDYEEEHSEKEESVTRKKRMKRKTKANRKMKIPRKGEGKLWIQTRNAMKTQS
jgi:hypothetical protein